MPIKFDVLTWVGQHLSGLAVGVIILFGFWQVRSRAKHAERAKKLLKKAIAAHTDEPLSLHPEVDNALCVGCGTCTQVCPEGEVLKLIGHRPVLVAPTKCVGHGECERNCPNGAIRLVFGTKTRGMDIPRISQHYETNVPGLYIAGELGGMGLIRNAIKQGSAAADHAIANLDPSLDKEQADVDLLIIGAGPAGLAAALTAIKHKKTYKCIEQNTFGGTVYNFPRQKIVMTYPAEIPGIGTMKFSKNRISKEELLAYWNQIREKTGFIVHESTRFESLEKKGEIFRVKTSEGVVQARKVILAMGVRGSPRKLGLPNEDQSKVTYNLIDPEQYQNQDVCVVGGGNAGVEAAQYLAKAPLRNRVTLLVRGPTFDRCNESNQKAIEELARAGRVKIRFNTSVKEIDKKALLIETKSEEKGKVLKRLPNDFLFVFAGAESPHKFLMSLGIQIEKKFGEVLRGSA